MFDANNLAFAYGAPTTVAQFKASADDFQVDEILSFELSQAGEHQFLRIEKRGLNTEELVRRLARCIDKPVKAISYAGLKDRQAVTTQWLSVHCPGEEIANTGLLQGDGWRVIEHGRHFKKLKIGGLFANRFTLVLRNIADKEAIEQRLQQIITQGVPNYFGPQRFGHQGQNLVKAHQMLLNSVRVKDRFLRGMYYSAMRSFLFNRILSARVDAQTWNKAIAGDVMQLAGTHSIFAITDVDDAIRLRIIDQDISPASTLWGVGDMRLSHEAMRVQEQALHGFEQLCLALEQHGLERAFRAHRLIASHLAWGWQDDCLLLSFELTPGAYATSVLRELVQF